MPRVPAVSKPSVASVPLVRGAGKNGAKAAPSARSVGQEQQNSKNEDEKEVCPLCIEDLDATDLSFQPCPCGYRVCLFCFKQLELHGYACPNCRRGYGSEEAREYAKQLEAERAQEALRPKVSSATAPAASTSGGTAAASRAPPKPLQAQAPLRRDSAPLLAAKRCSGTLDDSSGHGPSTGLPSGVTWASASPNSLSRNQSVEIERPTLSMDESSWPSLGAAPSGHPPPPQHPPPRGHSAASATTTSSCTTASSSHHHATSAPLQHQQQPQAQHAAHGASTGAPPPPPPPPPQQAQQQLRHSPSAASEGVNSYDMSGAGTRRSSSVASSMDRVASSSSLELMSQDPPVTPEQLLLLQHQHQQYQAQHAHTATASLSSSSSVFPPMPPPGFESSVSSSYFGAQVTTTVNGLRRAVNVPLSLGSSNVEPYPEAPALLASMQQGVAQGTLSSKDAASQLFALLRQKDAESQVARARSGLAATKPPPGFGAPQAPAVAAPLASSMSGGLTGQGAGAAAATASSAPPTVRPPPPPGFSHLPPAPPALRNPIQPPGQQANGGGVLSAGGSGPIGLNANGTPRTYSLWAGLPGMDLAATTGLSSLWQNLGATGGMSLSGHLGGSTTQPYNPLGLMDQSLAYGVSRQPNGPGAAPKPPPPGFGPAPYAPPGAAQQQQLGSGDAVLGGSFRGQATYQPVGAARYNPLNPPSVMPGAYRPPQLGAGM